MGVFKSLQIMGFSIASSFLLMVAVVPLASAQTTDPNINQSADGVSSQSIQNGLCNGANFKITEDPCNNANQDGVDRVTKVVSNAINTLSLIVGIVAVVMIMIGGLRYITSGGNDTSVTSAKNTILYAIIGLIIVALSQVMVRFVISKITE